jgi:hypothetical protein
VYGGRRFYTYHTYVYHPYHPYVWPAWHPVGFFISSLAATAMIVSLNNMQYHYSAGVFYAPYNGGYQVVAPPVSAVVPSIPEGYETCTVDGVPYLYYGGAFYVKDQSGSYQVVEAPAGALVSNLPEGCEQVNINNVILLKYNNTYFQPVSVNGKNAYEVAEME